MLGLNGFPLQIFLSQKVWGSSTTWLLSVDFPHFSVRCCFPHLWLQRFNKMPSARDLQLLHVLTFLICLQFCFPVDDQRSVKILSFACIKEALIWRVLHFWISRLSLASSCNLGYWKAGFGWLRWKWSSDHAEPSSCVWTAGWRSWSGKSWDREHCELSCVWNEIGWWVEMGR